MASTLVIACPECAKKFKGRDELQGKKVRCPSCGHAFVVAKGSGAAEPALVPPKPASTEDDEDGNPYGVTHLDLAPRCPHCAQEMPSAEAIICLHCGYNTQTRAIGSTKKVLARGGGELFLWLLPGLLCAVGILILVWWNLFYSLAMPDLTRESVKSWWVDINHESLRFWCVLISLGLIWGLGIFVYKRLILEPVPPERIKD